MRVTTIREDNLIKHVALIGRLDVKGVNEVQYEFHHETTGLGKPVIVDISKVTYIASLGISMLVSAAKYMERHGTKMVLLCPSALVRETIETSCLHDLIPIANEEADAIELLRSGQSPE